MLFCISRQTMTVLLVLWSLIVIIAADDDSAVRNKRITEGKIIDISRRPYHVGLLHKPRNKIICGGALVREDVVFTAAHCTHDMKSNVRKGLTVLVGANTVHDPKGRRHEIRKIVKHPDYVRDQFDNDFSVIFLRKPVEFNERVQPIRVTNREHHEGTRATLSGWGLTESEYPSKYLRKAHLTIDSNHRCQDYFPRPYHPTITRNMICAKPGHMSGDYGDSGGPLVVDDELVGVVSFGRRLGDKKITVFSKVKNFQDFIDSVI